MSLAWQLGSRIELGVIVAALALPDIGIAVAHDAQREGVEVVVAVPAASNFIQQNEKSLAEAIFHSQIFGATLRLPAEDAEGAFPEVMVIRIHHLPVGAADAFHGLFRRQAEMLLVHTAKIA